nr:MAG TPA: hypothetical protein [Caudoviricetes sp.]
MTKINVILFGVSKINVIFATCKKYYTPQRYEYLLIYKAKKNEKECIDRMGDNQLDDKQWCV